MSSRNDFLLTGYFCKYCYQFIDESMPGAIRMCHNCKKRAEITTKRKSKKVFM